MISLFTSKKQKEKTLAEFSDPFKKDAIQTISMRMSKGHYGGLYITGRVEFEINNTEGTQRFEAKNFQELTQKIEQFINQL